MSPVDQILSIGRLLDSLDIPWVLGGSLASSLVGEPRSTMDIDVAIRIRSDQVSELISSVERDYYASETMALEAVVRGSSFNLIHLGTGLKIDLFPLGESILDRRQLERRVRAEVLPGEYVWIGSPADQILRKLAWYRSGGEVSDRQWRDVQSILRVQSHRIDVAQLRRDARDIDLDDLLDRALAELGDDGPPESRRQ